MLPTVCRTTLCPSSIHLAHSCSYPGCGKVFVLDGNQKNHRDVCAATHAGTIEYEGLPGAIQSGCQFSPMYGSKYCFHHAPRVVKPCDPLSSPGEDISEGVMKFITGKRSTRGQITYQVFIYASKKHTIIFVNFGTYYLSALLCTNIGI